jgi:SAM-dependent methyltransferase
MIANTYIGRELDLFARAINWKRYWASEIEPYISGNVLEVGAGLGANTELLKSARVVSWTCLEPDPELVQRMRAAFLGRAILADCHILQGSTSVMASPAQFDAVLYMDVLEHIDDDRGELERAARLTRRGGFMIVLAPAHQWLYTPFDESIGHFRRYTRTSLARCAPDDVSLVRLDYFDSAGMLASLGNRILLRQSTPTAEQILFWDRVLVPVSRQADRLANFRLGKSVLGVWRKR